MNDSTSPALSWNAVAEFVAAGSIVQITIQSDLATVSLEIAYANFRNEQRLEATIWLSCLNCSYMTLSRLEHHDPGSGAIYEAYLHEQSPLINDLFANKLENKSGALVLQSRAHNHSIKHLEIIGEVNVNVLCEEVLVKYDQT